MGNYHTHVLGNKMDMVGGASLEAVTQVKKIVSGKLIDLNSSGSIVIMADAGIHDGAGTTRTITALEHIELKCGQASIKLSKDGTVTIKGTKIDMN